MATDELSGPAVAGTASKAASESSESWLCVTDRTHEGLLLEVLGTVQLLELDSEMQRKIIEIFLVVFWEVLSTSHIFLKFRFRFRSSVTKRPLFNFQANSAHVRPNCGKQSALQVPI